MHHDIVVCYFLAKRFRIPGILCLGTPLIIPSYTLLSCRGSYEFNRLNDWFQRQDFRSSGIWQRRLLRHALFARVSNAKVVFVIMVLADSDGVETYGPAN